MTEEMTRDSLKDIFQLLISRLCEEKGVISGREYTYGVSLGFLVRICIAKIIFGGVNKNSWFISITSWDIG